MATPLAALALFLALGFAGCAHVADEPIEKRLIGAWAQSGVVFGERKESVLTFFPDRTFIEEGRTIARTHAVTHTPLRGQWQVLGDKVRLEYASGFTGTGAAETEERQVASLTSHEFASTDTRFGIMVVRQRVAQATR